MRIIKKRKNYGFSLIELIAVMAIISIISTIAFPKITTYINSANKTKVIAAVSELNNYLILKTSNSNQINLKNLLENHSNLKIFKINLQTDGTFKVGNIKGNLVLKNDYINAILKEPKEFSGEIIGPDSK